MNLIERLRETARQFKHIEPEVAQEAGEAADALEALRGYAVHDEGCDAVSALTAPGAPCSCGLSDLLAKLGDA